MTELDLQARDLLRRFPLIDGHNDLPWELRERAQQSQRDGGDVSTLSLAPGDPAGVNLAAPVAGTHTDLPRLAAGGVGAQFWSVYVPASLAGDGAVAAVLEQIDVVRRMIAAYPEALELALTADDVERIFAAGRVASLLGAEGGIAGSLGVLRMLYALGVRYLTLTHNANVGWADSATDEPQAGGLTEFGRDVDVEVELVTESPAQYWEMISEHVSLAVAALAQAGEPARERIAKAVIARVSTYEEDGKVRIPGVAYCIVGTK